MREWGEKGSEGVERRGSKRMRREMEVCESRKKGRGERSRRKRGNKIWEKIEGERGGRQEVRHGGEKRRE